MRHDQLLHESPHYLLVCRLSSLNNTLNSNSDLAALAARHLHRKITHVFMTSRLSLLLGRVPWPGGARRVDLAWVFAAVLLWLVRTSGSAGLDASTIRVCAVSAHAKAPGSTSKECFVVVLEIDRSERSKTTEQKGCCERYQSSRGMCCLINLPTRVLVAGNRACRVVPSWLVFAFLAG